MANWISWAIVFVSLIHILEEYFGGWIHWVQRYARGVTLPHFVAVNTIFVFLCIAASVSEILLFQLTIASLIFVNTLIHVVPTLLFKHYSPGIWSAVFLYVPLSLLSYYSAWSNGNLQLQNTVLAIIIGISAMLLPISAQFLRIFLTQGK